VQLGFTVYPDVDKILFSTRHVNGGVKVYRWGGAKVYQLAHDGLMLL